jgi:hypothetical protein
VTVRPASSDSYDNIGIVDFDARRDLVVLKIPGSRLLAAVLGDSDLLGVGDKVFTTGAPKAFELTLSEGIVSGLRDTGEGYRVIQTSAAISPGSSGGGLFDEHARLVSVTESSGCERMLGVGPKLSGGDRTIAVEGPICPLPPHTNPRNFAGTANPAACVKPASSIAALFAPIATTLCASSATVPSAIGIERRGLQNASLRCCAHQSAS